MRPHHQEEKSLDSHFGVCKKAVPFYKTEDMKPEKPELEADLKVPDFPALFFRNIRVGEDWQKSLKGASTILNCPLPLSPLSPATLSAVACSPTATSSSHFTKKNNKNLKSEFTTETELKMAVGPQTIAERADGRMEDRMRGKGS